MACIVAEGKGGPVHSSLGAGMETSSSGWEGFCRSAMGSGASSGATEGSCWFGPWELRIGFGWLASLMVLSSHRDIVGFYYILWPIRTKGSIVLGSQAAQYTGCCRDGSPSLLLIPALLLRDPQNSPLLSESFSICGRAVFFLPSLR